MEKDGQYNNRGRGSGRGRGNRGRGRGRGNDNYNDSNNERQTNNNEGNGGRGRSNPTRGDTQRSRPPPRQEKPREEVAWNIGQLIVWLRKVLASDPDQVLSNLTNRDANKFRSALDGTVVFERGDMPLMVIQILSLPEIMDNIRTTASATLYELVLETKFFLNLETRLRYSSVRLNTENATRLIKLLSHLLTLEPESITQIDPLIEYFLANEDLYEDSVLYELDNLIIRKDYILQQKRQMDLANNQDTQNSSDYRRIPLFPSKQEMFTSPVAKDLRKNKVEGEQYDSVDDYLDMHFRLLHEDAFADLRRAVYNLHHGIMDKRLTGVKIYNNALVLGARLDFKGVFYQIQISSKINWARSKRLMPGSLLCLSCDNFASDLLWATVADRDEKKLAQGKFDIELTAGYDPNFHTGKVYTIIEASAAYFEAFGPVLRALQTKDNLPFQDYLLRYSPTIRPPKYLTSDAVPNNNDLWTVSSAFPGALKPSMHVLGSWPEPGELGPMVDASQLAALEQILTKEFAIVQGPPGTGKTYVGLQAAKLMLENKSPRPILCVCYTNHALDQFLEGIYEFEKKIIRLGGRSKSELMREQCSLFSPHWNKNVDKSIMIQRYQLLDEISDLKNNILDVADKLSASYISLSVLDTIFHPEQVDTLLTGPGKGVQQSQVLRKWLEDDKRQQPAKGAKQAPGNAKKIEKPSTATIKMEEVQTKSENIDDEEELDDEIDEDALGELLAEREDEEDTDLTQRQNRNAEAVFNVQQVEEADDVLTEDQFSDLMNRVYKTDNLWDIDLSARRQIHSFLLHEQRTEQKEEMRRLNEKYTSLCRKMKELNHVRTMTLLRQANVIGMTTTAAAKNVDLLAALKPKIVIVEEAAEVLEAHIITALTKDTEHLILIGDHQQLRPSTAVYALSKKYNLDVSLFERMTKNKVPYRQLLTQRRMRPEISQLIGPIYNKQLIDHPTVYSHPRTVKGVAKNVFFIDHTVPEQTVGDSTSKVNEHEVSFVANLCLYLVQQGYQPEKITVLTMYLQQLFRIKEQLKENNKVCEGCSSIRVSSVDNFQGEENDIIILSLVRSNNKKSIGFLKISNRVCVALSRARNAFYMIGNAQLLEQESPLWREVIQLLRANENIGSELKLCCQNHRENSALVKTGIEIREKARDGGCTLLCGFKLSCGHECKKFCHPDGHDKHICYEPCQRKLPCGHQCTKICLESCGECAQKCVN